MYVFFVPGDDEPVLELHVTYEEARRQARAMFGQHADVEVKKGVPFPARVGVWTESRGIKRFVYVGLGDDLEKALADARSRQS